MKTEPCIWVIFLTCVSSLRMQIGRNDSSFESQSEKPTDFARSETVTALNYLQNLMKMARADETVVAINHNASNTRNFQISNTYLDSPFFLMSTQAVRIGKWVNRVGNNNFQLMHAIAFAEAKGIPSVQYPTGGAIRHLFDLPKQLSIKPKLTSVHCRHSDGFLFGTNCYKNWDKQDFRRIMITYVKPHMKAEVAESCRSKRKEDLGLVIHLRGQDLAAGGGNVGHPQSRMPPCSFYKHLIASHNFVKVTAVAQDGAADLCANEMMKYKDSQVQLKVQAESLTEDACTIMESEYVTFGMSTFSESLTLLNERVKEIYVPSLKYNGMYNGRDMPYGGEGDQSGALRCGAQNCSWVDIPPSDSVLSVHQLHPSSNRSLASYDSP